MYFSCRKTEDTAMSLEKCNSVATDKRVSQWEELMRKFSEAHKEECKFTVEYDTGLQPAGRSYLTADQPTREIPLGYYDTGDGFFDPKTKLIYKPTDLTYIIRCPSIREQQWILDNCRTNPIKPLGPREDLYEKWSEPMVTPEVPPPPAAASRVGAASSATSAHMEDQEIVSSPRRKSTKPVLDRRLGVDPALTSAFKITSHHQ
ncbi:hypothetical protein MSG28_009581 [Choristoneura fumiferana]|uniref:Uncharacterized protein n=1 Tax=Choristoneura fumiferana TaxID=7141 RepID=A0ACC0JBP7_CHOFU|nr:hypothetical protein MSG28_009581 [Choristoneura fumiferana]